MTRESEAPIVKQEFSGTQLETRHETASTAMAERVKAEVQARYIMAIQRPRNLDVVRQRLLKECERPGFAEAARYHKPVGKGIEGPSIRFAEAAIRNMTNLDIQTHTTYDDPQKQIICVTVADLESNVPYSQDVVVQKTVERRNLKQGQKPLSERVNSEGQMIFIVPGTDDDVLNKTNALISKAIRTLGLRHLPGDILDECMDRCVAVTRKRAKADPDKARRDLLDAFFTIGVEADQIALYIGHDPKHLNEPELLELRAVYATVKQGEATWKALLEHKTGIPVNEEEDQAQAKRRSATEALLEKQKAKQAAKNKGKSNTKPKSEPKNAAPAEREREPGED
jgi:hypothetical protein